MITPISGTFSKNSERLLVRSKESTVLCYCSLSQYGVPPRFSYIDSLALLGKVGVLVKKFYSQTV